MSHKQGKMLSNIQFLSEAQVSKLAELYINTAEELIALVPIEGAVEGVAKQLSVSKEEMQEIMDKIQNEVFPRVFAAMTEPYAKEYGLGALMDDNNPLKSLASGPYESTIEPSSLPPTVNHIHLMRAIQNQGRRGTCVSFACTALNEFYYRELTGTSPDLSEQCLYARCKEVDGYPSAEGTWVRIGMECLVKYGECTESFEPYNPLLPTNQPGHKPGCENESKKFKLYKSQRLNPTSVNDIKGALADGKVVAFAIPVYNSWFRSAAVVSSGNITMPLPGETSYSGHAMLFVGYQDDPTVPGGGYFILRNSWGTGWGANSTYRAGYGTIPYQYMTSYGREAYTYERKPIIPCKGSSVKPIVCKPSTTKPVVLCGTHTGKPVMLCGSSSVKPIVLCKPSTIKPKLPVCKPYVIKPAVAHKRASQELRQRGVDPTQICIACTPRPETSSNQFMQPYCRACSPVPENPNNRFLIPYCRACSPTPYNQYSVRPKICLPCTPRPRGSGVRPIYMRRDPYYDYNSNFDYYDPNAAYGYYPEYFYEEHPAMMGYGYDGYYDDGCSCEADEYMEYDEYDDTQDDYDYFEDGEFDPEMGEE
ncbi:MAG: C1 family peptidase [Clostridia bacterium]|nr:C1 family peptidase [Clostridia bacterium]